MLFPRDLYWWHAFTLNMAKLKFISHEVAVFHGGMKLTDKYCPLSFNCKTVSVFHLKNLELTRVYKQASNRLKGGCGRNTLRYGISGVPATFSETKRFHCKDVFLLTKNLGRGTLMPSYLNEVYLLVAMAILCFEYVPFDVTTPTVPYQLNKVKTVSRHVLLSK